MRSGLVIELGEGVVRTVLKGRFANDVDTIRSMEMHMAMSEPRTKFKRGWARMVAVEADPASWEELCRWAYAQTRIPTGVPTSERSEARRLKNMADKVSGEIVRLGNHPAYRNLAVLGASGLTLPAYRGVLEDCSTFLGPTPGAVMTLTDYADVTIDRGHLEPHRTIIRGTQYTEWKFCLAPQ